MISLAGKRVLVTGGSRGIGRATALLCARAGADVAITYQRRRSDAEAVARAVRDMGRRAFLEVATSARKAGCTSSSPR